MNREAGNIDQDGSVPPKFEWDNGPDFDGRLYVKGSEGSLAFSAPETSEEFRSRTKGYW